MPKVTDAYREARRDEIIAAALRCFSTRGFQRTSMADIIAESGLSAGAIYGHFAGKKELFSAVAGRILATRRSELQARQQEGPPLSPGEVMATLIDGMRREPFSGVLIQLWAEAAIDEEMRGPVTEVLGVVRQTVTAAFAAWAAAEPGRIDGDPREWAARLTPVALGLMPGFMVQRAIAADFDEDAYLATLPEALPH